MDFVEIAPIAQVLTHTRFSLTLRSAEGHYRSLLLFRLAAGAPATARAAEGDEVVVDARVKVDGADELEADDAALAISKEEALRRVEEQLYAMESACPHLGADMSHADIEDADAGAVAVCPWHRYDFDLRTGTSDTGLKACVFRVQIRRAPPNAVSEGDETAATVWVEAPDGGTHWRLVEFRPVSEDFADPPPPPDLSTLSLDAPFPHPTAPTEPVVPTTDPPRTLIQWAVLILNTPHPQLKVSRTRHAVHLFRTGQLAAIGRGGAAPRPPDVPPREAGMKFVDPAHAGGRKSRAAMLHALANIEQWAIDLAWDSIARFGAAPAPALPHQFFSDFTKVALDEAKHFSLLLARLHALAPGTPFGALPVHAALWGAAAGTAHSLRARLALVHLVHEARGLDVNPGTIARFRRAGDAESVRCLEVIHADEVTHVTAGHRWFVYACRNEDVCPPAAGAEAGAGHAGAGARSWAGGERGVDPVQTFRDAVQRHFVGRLRGPFNVADREKAGLTGAFYEDLAGEGDGGVTVDVRTGSG